MNESCKCCPRCATAGEYNAREAEVQARIDALNAWDEAGRKLTNEEIRFLLIRVNSHYLDRDKVVSRLEITEDELAMYELSDGEIEQWFKLSAVVDGVRMGPRLSEIRVNP